MASEVCKAYIRGALVTNWFWNKLLGHPHPWNQRWCLQLWVNNHAPNITKVFSIIPAGLRDPENFRQSKRSSENRTWTFLSHHRCRTPLAWVGASSHNSQHGAAAPSSAHIPERGLLWLQGWAHRRLQTPPGSLQSREGSFGFVAWDHLCF